MDKHNSEWMSGGPWCNTSICKKLRGKLFEEFIRNARTDRYNIMSSIDVREKYHPSSCDDGSSGGGCPPPSNSTTEALVLLGATIYFIGCWIKPLEHNVIEHLNMYVFNMNIFFRKSQLNFLNNPVQGENANRYYMLLEVVGM